MSMPYDHALAFDALQTRLAALEKDVYAALRMASRLEDCAKGAEFETLERIVRDLAAAEVSIASAVGRFVKLSGEAAEVLAAK